MEAYTNRVKAFRLKKHQENRALSIVGKHTYPLTEPGTCLCCQTETTAGKYELKNKTEVFYCQQCLFRAYGMEKELTTQQPNGQSVQQPDGPTVQSN